ncbi:hypothetical protein [Hymenobacter bucti]|uniref:TonB-dependent receptor plug domain-containing protein n=1 Tax=Hymenobacter bucti TaxID=1844114 RepID=A0ABW4QNG0_9BACT
MPARQIIPLMLLAAGCLAGHLGWAQQAAIAPLPPATPVVAPPRVDIGAELPPKQSAAPAPTATTPQQSRPTIPEPVCIINGRYLTSTSALSAINPQQIDKIEIYKSGSGPVQWRSLTAPGIISITLKTNPKTKLKARSLAAIKRGLGLHGPVGFEFNGAPIQDESLRILTDAIAGFDITQATPGTAATTVVNIRSVPYKPKVHPPGTTMIRGLATQ